MKVAVIGAAGLIGQERVKALETINNGNITVLAFDINKDKLFEQNKKNKNIAVVGYDLETILKMQPDWVFISTTNDVTYDIAKLAFESGANILLEKPPGRDFKECRKIVTLKPNDKKLFVGFNYRFFNGVEAALHDAKNGKFGKLISVNLILAHGNAPDIHNSWYLDPIKRGSLAADLGVHLFDIILQLSNAEGNINVEYAKTWKGFFNTGIDEEAHIILTNSDNTIFNAQISYTRWRSNFRLEINGTEGYGVVEGRGKSFGPQSYRTGVRWGWTAGKNQADTEILVVDKDDCSNSFIKETSAVLGINNSTSTPCNHNEALSVMSLLDQI